MTNKKYLILLSVFVVLLTSGCVKKKEGEEHNQYNRSYVCSLEKGNSVSRVDFNLDQDGMTDSVYILFEGNVDDILTSNEQTGSIKDDITKKIDGAIHNYSIVTAGEIIKLELDIEAKEMKKIITYVFGENPKGFYDNKMDTEQLKETFTEAGYKCNK